MTTKEGKPIGIQSHIGRRPIFSARKYEMKHMKMLIKTTRSALLAALLMLCAEAAFAGDAKTYQVTGPVVAVTPTTITVQKGQEKWEINRDANTKTSPDIKVGAKVTIYYSMTATEIELKGAKGSSSTK